MYNKITSVVQWEFISNKRTVESCVKRFISYACKYKYRTLILFRAWFLLISWHLLCFENCLFVHNLWEMTVALEEKNKSPVLTEPWKSQVHVRICFGMLIYKPIIYSLYRWHVQCSKMRRLSSPYQSIWRIWTKVMIPNPTGSIITLNIYQMTVARQK